MSEQTIESFLVEMHRRQASDLLLTSGARPQYRVDGRLVPGEDRKLTPDDTRRLALSLLSDRQRQLLDTQRNVDLSRGYPGLSRFRFNVYYQRDSIALAVRLISFEIPSFETLGLPPLLRDMALRPHGLFLITGPAGSGKSTTLAAMIDHINHTHGVHVVCIEDPIEYLHTHQRSIVAQREIHNDAPSFAEALRSVFRQSPDVIMVGEMRDLETVQLAMTLAETGHLILGTLHTQDTTHAINRIVDMFPAHRQQQIYTQLSMVLLGVVAQRLLPRADGAGRVLACEIMNVNNAIRNLIRETQVHQLYSVIETGRGEGMLTLNASLADRCRAGTIDTETALRASPRPRELMRDMQRGDHS